jgi:CRP/FNR family transcriptional regulator
MERPTGVSSSEACEGCTTRLQGVLRGLGPPALARLEQGRFVRRCREGQVLHYEGNPASGVECIRSGRVKVYRAGLRERPHILLIAEPGDVLGIESVVAGGNHASTAEMIEDGTVCHIERDVFLRALEADPPALRAVAELLAKQLLRSDADRVELAGGNVRERIAVMLLELVRRYGIPQGTGLRIDLSLSREDLAEMVGAAPETAIRQLGELRREGIVATRGRSIVVEDLARLAHVASERHSDRTAR